MPECAGTGYDRPMPITRGLLIFALLTVPCTASADGIPPPPTCPDGTELRSCHGPAYCEVQACTSTSGCGMGETCASVSYCIVSHLCGGGRPLPDAESTSFTTDTALTTCDGSCEMGECRPMMACVPEGSSAAGGCACGVGPGRGSSTGFFAAAILALLLLVKRR